MNRKTLTIIFIALQILVLGSFVVRYELLKATGKTIYIPLRGYDPTDIWRGDYVNLAYELPYEWTELPYSYGENQYLIPIVEGKSVIWIDRIITTKPTSGTFFQIKGGFSNQLQKILIQNQLWETITYQSPGCYWELKVWDTVSYNNWNTSMTDTATSVVKKDSTSSTYYSDWKTGSISSVWKCEGSYRFQTTSTDRWFVPEWEGHDLEDKIRKGDMYAEWKVGNNGAIVITGVMSKDEIR